MVIIGEKLSDGNLMSVI